MWEGFFLFCGGSKKSNKFPSNLHSPIKKLNLSIFNLSLPYLSAHLSFYTCCQRLAICGRWGFKARNYQTVAILSNCTKVEITHNPRLRYIACVCPAWASGIEDTKIFQRVKCAAFMNAAKN
jgi:hypothetical protein